MTIELICMKRRFSLPEIELRKMCPSVRSEWFSKGYKGKKKKRPIIVKMESMEDIEPKGLPMVESKKHQSIQALKRQRNNCIAAFTDCMIWSGYVPSDQKGLALVSFPYSAM